MLLSPLTATAANNLARNIPDILRYTMGYRLSNNSCAIGKELDLGSA